jgi:hypothetical protein
LFFVAADVPCRAAPPQRPELLDLDEWYRRALPAALAGRSPPHATRDELLRTLKWKQMRGTPWPNKDIDKTTEASVREATTKAFAFAEAGRHGEALDAMDALPGVGPGLATALLAAFDASVPFTSDDALLAVVGSKAFSRKEALALQARLVACAHELNHNEAKPGHPAAAAAAAGPAGAAAASAAGGDTGAVPAAAHVGRTIDSGCAEDRADAALEHMLPFDRRRAKGHNRSGSQGSSAATAVAADSGTAASSGPNASAGIATSGLGGKREQTEAVIDGTLDPNAPYPRWTAQRCQQALWAAAVIKEVGSAEDKATLTAALAAANRALAPGADGAEADGTGAAGARGAATGGSGGASSGAASGGAAERATGSRRRRGSAGSSLGPAAGRSSGGGDASDDDRHAADATAAAAGAFRRHGDTSNHQSAADFSSAAGRGSATATASAGAAGSKSASESPTKRARRG